MAWWQRGKSEVALLITALTTSCGLFSRAESSPPPVLPASELSAPAPPTAALARRKSPEVAAVRWLIVGGGSTPDLSQVSLAQDAAAVAKVLGGDGWLLFNGGPGAAPLQVWEPQRRAEALRDVLADLFAPRGGRDSRYVQAELPIDGPATRGEVETRLRQLLERPGAPLTVWFATHGDLAETPAQNRLLLWEQSELDAVELSRLLDEGEGAREVRFVSTACFGGGLAEVAFRGADARLGAAATPRCGLFATTDDLPAAGCDPNPDRGAQEGYAVHFLAALEGRSAAGEPVAADVDGDGKITWLEAHAAVRIHARSADVPTTTSERWLRHAAPSTDEEAPVTLPEEEAVVRELAARLRLPNEAAAKRALQELEARIAPLDDALREVMIDEEEAARAAIAELLGRWPVLDDPWHPDFSSTLTDGALAIESHLAGSAAMAAYRDAQRRARALDDEMWALRRAAAPVARLTRAQETLALARRLKFAGGDSWRRYEALRACEAGVF